MASSADFLSIELSCRVHCVNLSQCAIKPQVPTSDAILDALSEESLARSDPHYCRVSSYL